LLHSLLLAPAFWLRHGLSEALTIIRWTVFAEGLSPSVASHTCCGCFAFRGLQPRGLSLLGTSQAWLRLQEGLMADDLFLALLDWGIVFAFLGRDRSKSASHRVCIGTLLGLLDYADRRGGLVSAVDLGVSASPGAMEAGSGLRSTRHVGAWLGILEVRNPLDTRRS
jgi:hypothetical protein